MRLDLHIHTSYSNDAIDPPSLVLKTAALKGLDAIAITDHNTVKGIREARDHLGRLLLIPGIEVDTREGHVIGLGIEKEIRPWFTAVETIEIIKDAGGVVVVPHPFDYLRHGVGSRAARLKADAIEVMNSKVNTPFSNTLAKRLAWKMKCPTTAGSDAHLADDVGNAYMLIKDEGISSVDKILSLVTSSKRDDLRIVGKITSLGSRIRKIALQRMKKRGL